MKAQDYVFPFILLIMYSIPTFLKCILQETIWLMLQIYSRGWNKTFPYSSKCEAEPESSKMKKKKKTE